MGIRVEFGEPIWDMILNLADREYRTPKQQVEYLVLCALGIELPIGDDNEAMDLMPYQGMKQVVDRVEQLEMRVKMLEDKTMRAEAAVRLVERNLKPGDLFATGPDSQE